MPHLLSHAVARRQHQLPLGRAGTLLSQGASVARKTLSLLTSAGKLAADLGQHGLERARLLGAVLCARLGPAQPCLELLRVGGVLGACGCGAVKLTGLLGEVSEEALGKDFNGRELNLIKIISVKL